MARGVPHVSATMDGFRRLYRRNPSIVVSGWQAAWGLDCLGPLRAEGEASCPRNCLRSSESPVQSMSRFGHPSPPPSRPQQGPPPIGWHATSFVVRSPCWRSAWASSSPRRSRAPGIEWGVPAVGGPRVLGRRGAGARPRRARTSRLRDAEAELARQGEIEEANRGLLESMIAEPERYRWVRVAAEDVGERPCQHWHSRPRWGILGMLLGWWRVKHSSGCPLATGLAAPVLAR